MLNKVLLMGRVTKDLELRRTGNGTPVLSFALAVDRDYKSGNEKQTDFVECVAWRNTAEFISKYFGKGRMMVVEGALQSRKWQDKSGQNRTAWEVQVANAYFGDSKRGDSSNTVDDSEATPPPQFTEDIDDGEIPF